MVIINLYAPKFQLQEHMESIVETANERPFRENWFPKAHIMDSFTVNFGFEGMIFLDY